MKRLRIVSCVLMMSCGAANDARAASIQYTTTAIDEHRWEYAYFVRDVLFDVDQGFSVYFDPALYQDLQPSSTISTNWDILAVQPDSQLPSSGFYDALALVSGASTADPFLVSFEWLGAPGTVPGAQPFTINQFDAGGTLSILQRGETAPLEQQPGPVPEPSTFTLTVIAAAGVLRKLRKSRAS